MTGRAHLQDINSLADIVAACDRGGGKRTGGEHSRAARRELRREALRRAARRNEGRGIRDAGSEQDGTEHDENVLSANVYRALWWRTLAPTPMKLLVLWCLAEGGAAFTLPGRVPQLAPAFPHRAAPMAFYKPPPPQPPQPPPPQPLPPPPPPPPPPPDKSGTVKEARTKYLDASAKNGVDSAQALAALKEYEAVLTSQTLVSPRTPPHAARASHTTPYNTAPAIQHQRQ